MRGSLVSDPWVREVVVRRVFPHTLSVRVLERQPMAVAVLDGMPTVVDGTGVAIVPWSPRLGELDLPLVTGVDDDTAEARAENIRAGMEALAALRRHHQQLLDRLSEVDMSRTDRITARFIGEPGPLLLSRQEVTANLDHYLAIRDDILPRVGAVKAIDLRWRGRVVVVPAGRPPRSAGLQRSTPRGGERG